MSIGEHREKSARGPHRRDVTHILSKVSCFLLKFFHFRRLRKRQFFFPIQILLFRMLRNNADVRRCSSLRRAKNQQTTLHVPLHVHHASEFCTFLCSHFTASTWKWLVPRFVENVNTRQQLYFSFPELRYNFLKFNSRKNCQHLPAGQTFRVLK